MGQCKQILEKFISVLNHKQMKGIGWKLSAKEMLNGIAHLKSNLCIISENNVTLVIADNKIENKNMSYFLGSSKVIKLGKVLNKNAIDVF